MSNIKHSRTISLEDFDDLEGPLESLPATSQDKSKSKSLRLPKDTDLKELAEDTRYYLPVLHINDPKMWESRPKADRLPFTPEVATETCLSNCCGTAGVKSACCTLDPDDLEHVLGPVTEAWIKRTIKWFKKNGINVTRSDVVIDFDEGKLIGQAHFNDHKVFKSPDSYPILRIQAFGPRFACKFMSVHSGKCTIYEQRPDMCSGYYCQYVKSNFLVKTKNSGNKYIKVDTEKEQQ